MVLSKSMQELDAMAENLLKSQNSEKADDNLNPENIAENAPSAEENNTATETGSSTETPAKAGSEKSEETKTEDGKASDEQLQKSEPEANTAVDGEDKGEGEKTPQQEDKTGDTNNDGDEGSLQKSNKPAGTPVKTVNENDANGGESSKEKVEDLQKSHQQNFNNEGSIAKSVEASEFLAAITEVLSKALGQNSFDLIQLKDTQNTSNDVLAKSLQASLQANSNLQSEIAAVRAENADLKKSIGAMTETLEGIAGKLDDIGHQPTAMRKSVNNIQVMDKNFTKSLDSGASSLDNLSKSEVMGMLSAEMYSGNPVITPTDIISYESGAPLRAEVAAVLATKLR